MATIGLTVPSVVGASPAHAAGEQAVIGMPFDGKWAYNANVNPPYTDTNSSHPSVHTRSGMSAATWATDLYPDDGGNAMPVKLHVNGVGGTPTFSWVSSTTSCGTSTMVKVTVGGVDVGTLYLAHLSGAVTSGTITNGMTLGYTTSVSGGCNPGRHVHVEFTNLTAGYSCYADRGHPGSTTYENDAIGVLGSSNTGARQACTSVPSGGSQSMDDTASTLDSPYGGDFNGDGYGDVFIAQKRSDGGADLNILFGEAGAQMFAYNPTLLRSLSGPTWDYDSMKFAVGKFNADGMADLAIFHKRSAEVGADLHIFYGAAQPFQANTAQRNMPASQGWNWSEMKIVSADFDGDGWDDVAVGHKSASNGMDVHLLTGGVGVSALANSTTFRIQLAGPTWNWSQIKLAAGKFNNDGMADLAVVHARTDGGFNIHTFKGASGLSALTQQESSVGEFPGTSGWNWSQIKLAAGYFNGDAFADLAIIHQRGDGGADVHMAYGQIVPFQTVDLRRQMPGTQGWNWGLMKFAAGPFNNDAYGDLAVVHQSGSGGADVHVLYGAPNVTVFQFDPTYSGRSFTTAWSLLRTA